MKLSLEAQMTPLWGAAYSHMTWRAGTEDLRALSAWIDLHISNPDFAFTQEDWEWLLFCVNQGFRARPEGVGKFETALLDFRERHRRAKNGLDRILQRFGVPEECREEYLRGGAEALYEAAGLSPQEQRALELSMVYLDDFGRPELSRIAKDMERRQNGQTRPMGRATVSVYISRAKKKLLRHLKVV